ncbi:MAG: type toxin-antitoxin system RelE/ParE family toxin [Hyphomicrobiales bacterium]|nr:type toxin-antitoxin system RelE/ParE family toxin [Hyphomicrobiales bacterium]
MIVVLTAQAEADLEAIGDYLAQERPSRALLTIGSLRHCCNRLAEFPEAFPFVQRYERIGLRRRIHENYLIFYRASSERIEVIRILHGAMDYESLLLRED